jgi:Flp pilus assembly protein TadB
MLGYYITSAICLFFLVMIPIWSAQSNQPQYPFAVILLLAVIVFAVPMVLRRRKREGAAAPGALPVTVDNLAEVDAANQRQG